MVLSRWNLGKFNDGKDRVMYIYIYDGMHSLHVKYHRVCLKQTSLFNMRGHSFILNVDCDIKRYIIENHMFVIEKLDEKREWCKQNFKI